MLLTMSLKYTVITTLLKYSHAFGAGDHPVKWDSLQTVQGRNGKKFNGKALISVQYR
jgi:hypothetical protein